MASDRRDVQPSRRRQEDSQVLHDLRVFHEVARSITSALDRESIIRAVMAQMTQVFRPESWSLLLLDEAENNLFYAIHEGRSDHPVAGLQIPVGEGMAGWVAAHGEPLIVEDMDAFARAVGPEQKIGRPSPLEMRAASLTITSAITIPLRSRGRTVGVLQLLNYRLEAMTDYAMTFVHILADYAAIAIENMQALDRVQQLTIIDDSTRLFNTRHLHAALQAEFERSRRFHTEFSVIFIDLDYFKHVNDTHGHIIGTELLVEVAQLLRTAIRTVDTVFRYGGDEFVVLLPQTGRKDALEVAARLLVAMRKHSFLAERSLNLQMTASFGVSTYPEDGESPSAVLERADAMMYTVKRSSRNNVAIPGGEAPLP